MAEQNQSDAHWRDLADLLGLPGGESAPASKPAPAPPPSPPSGPVKVEQPPPPPPRGVEEERPMPTRTSRALSRYRKRSRPAGKPSSTKGTTRPWMKRCCATSRPRRSLRSPSARSPWNRRKPAAPRPAKRTNRGAAGGAAAGRRGGAEADDRPPQAGEPRRDDREPRRDGRAGAAQRRPAPRRGAAPRTP